MKKILVIAGDPSGEKHTAGVIRKLAELIPSVQWRGVGGNEMQAAGASIDFHVNQTSIMGFIEVIKHLPFLKKMEKELVTLLDNWKPDLVFLTDYPGFNLRFAAEAKKRNIPVIYFISPQIWAWGKSRIKKIPALVDHMLVILPFEKTIYDNANVPCTFVGHPLLEQLNVTESSKDFFSRFNLTENTPLIGLIPGSRNQEVKSLLPVMVQAVMPLIEHGKIQVVVAGVKSVQSEFYQCALEQQIPILFGETHAIMKHSHHCVVTSGTATLETSLFETPLIVVYKSGWMTYLMGRYLVKLDRISLVNIIANEMIVPELIQHEANSSNIRTAISNYLMDKVYYQTTKNKVSKIRFLLGEIQTSESSAKIVAEFLK